MNLHWIDWSIILALLAFITIVVLAAHRHTKSVADFLATGRCAGRYVLSVAGGMAGMGAVTLLGTWEVGYEAGFTASWWQAITSPVGMIITLSGFAIYRYRQTRAMTLAQFVAMRYSTRLRLFVGVLAFVTGVFTFGIYPAVSARFIIYFIGLPDAVPTVFGTMDTYPIVLMGMGLLVLFFTATGGQISLILSDFFQGLFVIAASVGFIIFIFLTIDWNHIGEAFANAPAGKSMIDPLNATSHHNFNMWFYVIAAFSAFYAILAFQGAAGFSCSAKSPHEAKMGRIYGHWNGVALYLAGVLFPIIAYTIMHHPAYAALAAKITGVLSGIENPTIRNQQTVPIVLSHLLPMGLRGALCATVLAAFISNQGSGLHSWGSILLQDVIMPFRKTAFDPKRHIMYLRLCIGVVAIIVFGISLLYRQTQAIFMFFALTAGMFVGGAGAMVLGGLYWKRGTTAGAWVAMLTGLIISLGGFICEQVWVSKFGKSFPINGQYIYATAMVMSIAMYVIFSLIENKIHDMDKLLHRGKYSDETQHQQDALTAGIPSWLVKMGLSNEFSKSDKGIFYWTFFYTLLWFGQWVVVNVLNLFLHFDEHWWLVYWRCVLWFTFVLGMIIAVWFTIGGVKEIREMFVLLKNAVRNYEDNGMVVESHKEDKNIRATLSEPVESKGK